MRNSLRTRRRDNSHSWIACQEVWARSGRIIPGLSSHLSRKRDTGGKPRKRKEGAEDITWRGARARCCGSRFLWCRNGKRRTPLVRDYGVVAAARALCLADALWRSRVVVRELLLFVVRARAPPSNFWLSGIPPPSTGCCALDAATPLTLSS